MNCIFVFFVIVLIICLFFGFMLNAINFISS